MLLFPIAVATGVALGYLRGGRLRHLSDLDLRASLVLVAALGLQLGAGLAPEGWRFPITVCSYAAVAAWLVVNAWGRTRQLRVALGLLAAGWLLNLAAIVPNGGMPVSLHAAREVGAHAHIDVTEGNLYKHVPASGETALPWLGDVVPVSALGSVISVGDVVMFLGLVLALGSGMAPKLDRAPDPPPRAERRRMGRAMA